VSPILDDIARLQIEETERLKAKVKVYDENFRLAFDRVQVLEAEVERLTRELAVAQDRCPVCRCALTAHEDGCVVVDGQWWRAHNTVLRGVVESLLDLLARIETGFPPPYEVRRAIEDHARAALAGSAGATTNGE